MRGGFGIGQEARQLQLLRVLNTYGELPLSSVQQFLTTYLLLLDSQSRCRCQSFDTSGAFPKPPLSTFHHIAPPTMAPLPEKKFGPPAETFIHFSLLLISDLLHPSPAHQDQRPILSLEFPCTLIQQLNPGHKIDLPKISKNCNQYPQHLQFGPTR